MSSEVPSGIAAWSCTLIHAAEEGRLHSELIERVDDKIYAALRESSEFSHELTVLKQDLANFKTALGSSEDVKERIKSVARSTIVLKQKIANPGLSEPFSVLTQE
jgi:hypothetical protein